MAKSSQFQQSLLNDRQVVIESGNTISNSTNLQNTSIVGFSLPSNFNGDKLSFQVSTDGLNFYNFRDINNNNIIIDVTSNNSYSFGRDDFLAWGYVKFIANQTQLSQTIITLQTRAGG